MNHVGALGRFGWALLGILALTACTKQTQASRGLDPARATLPHVASETSHVQASSLPWGLGDGFATGRFDVTVEFDAWTKTHLEIGGAERNPNTSQMDEWEMTESTGGLVVEGVTMRHTNDWYVAFRLTSGQVMLERWEMNRTDGAYYSDMDTAPTGIGTEIRTPPLVVAIQNDRYSTPADRTRPTFTRSLIHPGLALDRITVMMVDPDARYLLLVVNPASGGRHLIQVALLASASTGLAVGDIIPLLDFSAVPEVVNAVSFGLLEHPRRGRAISVGAGWNWMYLWDLQNDGLFESSETMNLHEAVRDYPYEGWSRSF